MENDCFVVVYDADDEKRVIFVEANEVNNHYNGLEDYIVCVHPMTTHYYVQA